MSDQTTSGELTELERNTFLSRPIIARLATASPKTMRPHVVPVWFLWDGASLWISSYRSTRKIKDLLGNPYCSVAIDEAQSGLDYQAVVMEGRVELIDQPVDEVKRMFAEIYEHYLGPAGVLAPSPQEWINDPENMLIKLTPEKTFTWYSRAEPEA